MKSMTSGHLLFFIPALSVVAIKTYPTLFTKPGQRDSWIAMIIAVAIIFTYMFFLLLVCKKRIVLILSPFIGQPSEKLRAASF